MTTIHYSINIPNSQHRPDTQDGRFMCDKAIEQALNTAAQLCSAVHETTATDVIVTSDHYLVDLHLTGECLGCEPISFGWTKDFEPPHSWVMRGFCKTSTARDSLKAHLLVAHIVEAWRHQGLVDWIEDEAGYLPDMNLSSLMDDGAGPPPQQMQTWIASLGQAL